MGLLIALSRSDNSGRRVLIVEEVDSFEEAENEAGQIDFLEVASYVIKGKPARITIDDARQIAIGGETIAIGDEEEETS